MKTLIIKYELSKIPQYQKVLLNRKLFGYKDNSNKCAYTYQREGILKRAEHIKLGRGAIVIKERDKDQILKVFRKFKIKPSIIPAEISEFEFTYY